MRLPRLLTCTAAAVSATLVAGFLTEPAPAHAADGHGSLAAGLSGAGSTVIDERTGLLGMEFPLGEIPGVGASAVTLSVAYAQPFGTVGGDLGHGWRWGLPKVESGSRVSLADGRSFAIDPKATSGLSGYSLTDGVFTTHTDPLAAGAEGCPATRACKYTLKTFDGAFTVFDTKGLPAADADRFGNVSRYSWNSSHQLTRVEGGFDGARVAATLEYVGSNVTVSFPERIDGSRPTATLLFRDGRLWRVTDTGGSATELSWVQQGTFWFPSTWMTSTGARVDVTYERYEPGVYAVKTLTTRDTRTNAALAPALSVSLNPADNGGRNHTGYPKYHNAQAPPGAGTTDPLLASDDRGYTYQTSISDGQKTTVRTFNNRHQKVLEATRVRVDGIEKTVSTQEFAYPGAGAAWPQLPPMYQVPQQITQTTIDPAMPARTRKTSSSTEFTAGGLPTREVIDGIETVTRYDTNQTEPVPPGTPRGYGLPIEVTRTVLDGPERGHQQRQRMTLAPDRKSAVEIAEEATDPATGALTAVQTKRSTHTSTGEVAETTTIRHRDDGEASTTEATSYRIEGGTRVVTATSASGATRIQKLDAASGLPVEEIDPAGLVTTHRYDGAGREIEKVQPGGVTITTKRTEAGLAGGGANTVVVTRSTDGYVTRETRDALNRVVRTEDNQKDGRAAPGHWRVGKETAYDKRGRIESQRELNGRITRFGYDDADRRISAAGPDGSMIRTEYDEVAGITTQHLYAEGASAPAVTQRITADDQGRTTRKETSYGDSTPGNVTTYRYTAFGGPASTEQSAAGQTITNTLDATGAPTGQTITDTTTGEQLAAATFDTDVSGNPTGKTLAIAGQGEAAAHAFGYDQAGRLTTDTDGAGATTSTRYDAAGRPEVTTYPDGRTFHTAHDPATGAITTTWWQLPGAGEQQRKQFEYDPSTGKVAAVWFTADKAGTILRYAYQPDGNIAAVTYPDGKTLSYEYSDTGELSALTDPAGVRTVYGYDDAGRLTTVKQPGAQVSYEWDDRGSMTELVRKDGSGAVVSTTTLTHNDAGQLLTQTTVGRDGALVEKRTHTWTPRGLLDTTITELGDGPLFEHGPHAGAATTTTKHEYDAQGRLTGTTIHAASTAGGEVLSRTRYQLSAASDVVSSTTTTKDGVTTTSYQLDAAGRQTTVQKDDVLHAQEWDANGNLLKDARGYRFGYTAEGRLASWTTPDGATTELTWRPDGTRHTKTGPDGTVTTYAMPGSTADVITETVDGRTVSSLLGTTREALTGDSTRWLVADRRGDIVAVLGKDGEATARAAYTDYGVATTAGDPPGHQPFGYAGAYTDAGEHGTGHLWLASRHYVPETTAFTTQDTADLLNRYAYGAANPVMHIDPTGHSIDWRPWTALGFAVAGFIAAVFTVAPPAVVLASVLMASLDLTLSLDDVGLFEHIKGSPLLSDEATDIAAYSLQAATFLTSIGPAVVKKLLGLYRKLRPPSTALVDTAIPVETYEDLAQYAYGVRQLRNQNCVSANATVCKSILTGELRAADEGGGKYITKRNHQRTKRHSQWNGPFQTDAELYEHMSMYPEGSVFTVLQRGYHGQTGCFGDALTKFDAGHFTTAVRTGPQNTDRRLDQIFDLDGYWGEVREISRTDTDLYEGEFWVVHEGTVHQYWR